MLLQAMVIAFAMYSKIPMPRVEWTEKNMRYALCFFPLIGVVIGVVNYYLASLLLSLNVGKVLLGSIMTVTPVLITGGIHFDGFLDTMDGISSYADKEKRLEILKDSNSGAFAIIGGLVYFMLSLGFWSEVRAEMLSLIAVGYTMSRSLSGLSVICFPKARKTGLVTTFNDSADRLAVKITMLVLLCLEILTAVLISPIGGLLITAVSGLCFAYHYYNCMKSFGGITGDLAGWFLQLCELGILIAVVILFRWCMV